VGHKKEKTNQKQIENMSIFGGKKSDKIEYLEDERKKLWDRILLLEKKLDEKPSDFEREAKQASKKAAEFRNRTEDRLNQANEIIDNLNQQKANLDQISSEINRIKEEVTTNLNTSIEATNSISERSKELLASTERITEIFDEHPELKSEVADLQEIITSLEEDASKANTTYKGILSKKTEIDELHREIIGYEDEGEDGEVVPVEGLKDELETAYNELNQNLEDLKKGLNTLTKESQTQFDKFSEKNKEEIETLKTDSKSDYDEIIKRIETLLPTAMTAGLSSAFVKKRGEEEKIYVEYKKKFNRGILLLSLVSILPITISIIFLWNGISLSEVISRSPKVILSFMPLYIPLIWSTISANKKVNLSKRLIEEYSHKQVLSMTIEGLSNQIADIADTEISKELRIQLIRNFLAVSSENPGKLISNYQKSDNPILNLFDREKSTKKAEEKSIVKTVEDSAKRIVNKATTEIEEGIVKGVKNTLNE
jgi:hypothetical protein